MIDWGRVDELRDEVGAEAFDEVLELFLEEVDEAMGRLEADGDPDGLSADLHFVRGSALNLGLRDFCALCQMCEQQLAQGQDVDLGPLHDSYARSKAVLLAGRAEGRNVA